MRSLVVYESVFGNTRLIAQSIADGLSDAGMASVTDVAEAPDAIPPDVDLVVVGGPTHAFSMSRPSTREDAVRRGGSPDDVPEGIREWLQALPEETPPRDFAAFDTRVRMPLMPGAASRAATRSARHRGLRVQDPESFFVKDYEGPLLDGELDRARRWGHDLGMRLANTSARGEGFHEPL